MADSGPVVDEMRVDPETVPPSQLALSGETSKANLRLQSTAPSKASNIITTMVDPKTVAPSQYALSTEPSKVHQRLPSNIAAGGRGDGTPKVDTKTAPPSQNPLSEAVSQGNEGLQYPLVNPAKLIPSAVAKAGSSKFGKWKRKPAAGSSVLFEDETEGQCDCNPCLCTTPPNDDPEDEEEEEEQEESIAPEPEPNYNLSNFMRAKEFFMTSSTKTGISLYDHFSELIRKLLDNRAPDNPVDFVEEISLNLKRYRFGMVKDVMENAYHITERMLKDAEGKIKNWKKHALWSAEQTMNEIGGEGVSFGGFPNLLRLQYYLDQINLGLPREEMFKIALVLRQIKLNNPVTRVRFWGKVIGIRGNYYIFEAEIPDGQLLNNTWTATPETPVQGDDMFESEEASAEVPGPVDTFERAGRAVTNPEVFTAYQTGSSQGDAGTAPATTTNLLNEYPGEAQTEMFDGVDPEEVKRWLDYQEELMQGIPTARPVETIPIPPEDVGKGANRRIFFVLRESTTVPSRQRAISDEQMWNNGMMEPTNPQDAELNEDEEFPVPLGPVTPEQINVSRRIRWYLTGDLNAKVLSDPHFPGREGDYLHALLVRITAGTAISPRGYYRTKKFGEEYEGEEEDDEDEEDIEEEEEEVPKGDVVYPNKKFRYPNIAGLASKDVELWVHHAAYILRQGRVEWYNTERAKEKKKGAEDDEDLEDEEVEEEEEEEDETENRSSNREIGPKLFSALTEDKSLDPAAPPPWTARASSSVFTEFQVANVRSNLWPGANALCTQKGKVENIYLGDGLKFWGRSYAPFVPNEPQAEYKDGPELIEIVDPTVEEEQAWLAKLQLEEIADVEEKFVDNEDEEEEGEGDDEEDED